MRRLRFTLGLIAALLAPSAALAQAQGGAPKAFQYYYSGTGPVTSPPSWLPVSATNPLPVTLGGSSGTVSVKSGSYVSAGAGQFALAIGTNTQLTVPAGSVCAQITVESSSIRRTSDTTGATTTNGTLIQTGAQWQDCGPLAAYKFTAVSGSPTLDVEYFK